MTAHLENVVVVNARSDHDDDDDDDDGVSVNQ